MIFDTLKNLPAYRNLAPQAVELLLEALPGFSADSPNGKTVLIEDKLFILIQRYNTRPVADSKVETHAEFADLQMLLDGSELIGYAPVEQLEELSAYDAAGDYALYEPAAEKVSMLKLQPGNFTVYLPGEGHMPGCGDGTPVVKAVIKIHKSLLN